MKKTFLPGICLVLLSFTSFSQDITFPEQEGFKKITKYPVYLPENLWDFINGAAENYLSLGFVDLHVAEYKKGKDVIKLEIYRHRDNTMAFGIYASERSPSFTYINLGSQGYVTDGITNFYKGNFYVKLRTFSAKPKTLKAQEILAARVAAMLPGKAETPQLLSLFPDEGKKPNEETYVHESVLGHQFLNRGFKASYQAGSDIFSIYVLQSGSAEETHKSATAYLATAKLEPGLAENRYLFTDGYNGTIFLAWKENMMVIISGLAKDQADIADKYTSLILR
ncbi:MAG: hypothetical protein MUE74_12115 [Bacteroidales bacterium]|jgi:hypothetical protein|nr:hypothetical protein [Bacteroidales bacterium]